MALVGGMSATELKEWAKEEVRDALLEFFRERQQSGFHLNFDEREALKKQINRALKTVSDQQVE